MARIAFFTERLPPDTDPISEFSYDLICSLAEQQHHVRVVSTFNDLPLPPSRPRIEIIRPFRDWSWFEIPKLIPSLVEFGPEILHIIQPRAESMQGFTSAMNAIPSLGVFLSRPAIVSSFYDLSAERLGDYRQLLISSDMVTVSTQPQSDLLRQYLQKQSLKDVFSRFREQKTRKTVPIQVVPAPSSSEHTRSSASGIADEFVDDQLSATLQTFLKQSEKVILVPGDISDHREVEELFSLLADTLSQESLASVVFAGGWGSTPSRRRHQLMRVIEEKGVGSRVLLTGPLTRASERLCLDRATIAITAFLPPESLNLTRILREALVCNAPLLMSSEQASTDPLSWQNRKTSVAVDLNPRKIKSAVLDALNQPLSDRSEQVTSQGASGQVLVDVPLQEAFDQPGNVMSRIYAQLLARKP